MLAFILIRVPALRTGGAVQVLKSIPGVVEAHGLYGESDVIVKVDVPDNKTLDELVMEKIQGLPEVESTRTFIVVESLEVG